MRPRTALFRRCLLASIFAWMVPPTLEAAAPPAGGFGSVSQASEKKTGGDKDATAGNKGKNGKKDAGARVELGADGFEIESAGGDFELRIGGRLQVDAAFHDQDASRLGDGTEIRRARIYFKGRIFRKWGYKSQFELSDGDVSIKDMYLDYSAGGTTTLTIGNFKEPFSLEDQTSSKNITFLERSLPVAAFAPSRALGVSFRRGGRNTSLTAGVFGEPIDTGSGSEDQGFGLAARSTWAPWDSKDSVLHLGAATEYREPRLGEEIRFDSRPESSITAEKLIRTRSLGDIENTHRYGLEMALVASSVSLQGEYILTGIERSNSADAELSGWYFFASWFPTGERRSYDADEGTFGRVEPRGKRGAWEVALRLSELDLDDPDAGIAGGQERNTTLALNWYPNSNLRFMANYILVDSKRRGEADDPQILLLRAQVAF